ncbi:MAG: hypothetical protein M0D57_04130 [Sphingobacteriales bacterium JAD_PAG50586_3]|nr:MAG: hypothetical protein M0D57_04130 [Sphingobacteriales bacterium JAD_PAG50586_3]
MNPRIVKIVPYFGKLPSFWPIYAKSLSFNKQFIDLLFITDIDLPVDLPDNMRVIKMTLSQFFDLAETKTGLKIPEEARYAYKLCDFKPLFGYIFEEEIKEYPFWAFGDIDLIYGNLGRYLKPHITNNYDIITFIEAIVCAPFTILKNTKEIRELFKQSPDLPEIFVSKKYLHFDEAGKKSINLLAGDTIQEAIAKKSLEIFFALHLLFTWPRQKKS